MSSIEQNLEEWVNIDNQIKKLNERLSTLKEQRKVISDNIFENNNIESDKIIANLSDSKLKIVKTKVSQSLTFTYLENCLNEIITSPEQVETIMNHVKSNRNFEYVTELKRIYNK
jgi:hypothetical protein